MKFLKKLVKGIAFTLLFLLALLLLFIVLIKKMPEKEYSQLDATDRKMFDELTLQYKNFREKPDAIWTSSYRYDQKPLILIRSQKNKSIWRYVYLINAGRYIDPKKFKKIDFPGNPYLTDVYAATTLGSLSAEYWIPGAFTFSLLKGKKVLAFKYYPELFQKEGSFPDFKYFSMHEAFHGYAQKTWMYDKDANDHIIDYPFNKEHFDLLKKEYVLLDQGLRTDDTIELNDIMRAWVQIRKERYKRWPQLINEANSEAIEGTARYIEYKYAALIGKPKQFITDHSGKVFSFSQGLEMILHDEANYYLLTRSTSYDKGAALGYILDKLDPSWKYKIEDSPSHKGMTLYEILKSRY
ncbi:hypothetical protein ODZ84_20610 [Chryseobacterium fluminis]|uniref:hypothetical protein n=1 Tax=Chryseobacterium fluminis TaxID=2983606 RepID=UPI002254A103|nr:hypothetical protein [Chryseobacterium sp. MMS21-Ot14]UZT97550.1 hypothetical protein ODZ84_20610 [Chryseobacterium sp. MMS21-Ot14]